MPLSENVPIGDFNESHHLSGIFHGLHEISASVCDTGEFEALMP